MPKSLQPIAAILVTLVSFTASAQLATNITLTNIQGHVYKDITLDHTNKLGIIWSAADGSMGQIKYKDLPADQLTRFGISPKVVAGAVAAEEKAKKLDADLQAAYAKASAAMIEQSQNVQVTSIIDEVSNHGMPLCSVGHGGGGGGTHPIPSRVLLRNLPGEVTGYLHDYQNLKANITTLEAQPITVTANSTLYNSDGSVDQFGSQLATQSAAGDALYQAKEAKRDKLDQMNRRLHEMEDSQFEHTGVKIYLTGQTYGGYEIWVCSGMAP